MIRAIQKRFTAQPTDGKKLDAGAVATGKQGVTVGIKGKNDAEAEREAATAGLGNFGSATSGSYGGERGEREARWRNAAKSS